MWVYSWNLYSVPWHLSIHPAPFCLITAALGQVSKSASVTPSTVLFLFKVVMATLGSLHFHVNLRIGIPIFTKMLAGIWLGPCWIYRSTGEALYRLCCSHVWRHHLSEATEGRTETETLAAGPLTDRLPLLLDTFPWPPRRERFSDLLLPGSTWNEGKYFTWNKITSAWNLYFIERIP